MKEKEKDTKGGRGTEVGGERKRAIKTERNKTRKNAQEARELNLEDRKAARKKYNYKKEKKDGKRLKTERVEEKRKERKGPTPLGC